MGEADGETGLKNMQQNWLSTWRIIVPLVFLAATVGLLLRHEYPLPPDTAGLLWLSRLDPLLLLAEWRVHRTLPYWFWLPAGIVVLTLLFGRVFCGWICPVGGLLAHIPVRPNGFKVPHWAYRSRYLWLVFLLGLLLTGSNWPLLLTPFHLITEELSRLTQGKMAWLAAVMLLMGIVFFPRFWCVYICPTGILLAALSRWRRVALVVGDSCIGCGACINGCRTKAVDPRERKVAEDCMLCGRCWQACSVQAIYWKYIDILQQPNHSTGGFSRRQLLTGGVMLFIGGLSGQLLTQSAYANVIRPPGALPEAEFVANCSRCGRCVKVCPAGCLVPMPLEAGFNAFLTPEIIPRKASCDLCLLCQEVCPTSAIRHVPLEKIKMGTAQFDRANCLVWAQDKVCLLCREQCPVHAIGIDEQRRPYVNEDLCAGCGACEKGCPLASPAITVRPNRY